MFNPSTAAFGPPFFVVGHFGISRKFIGDSVPMKTVSFCKRLRHTISISNIENISCRSGKFLARQYQGVGLKISPTYGIIRLHGYIGNLIVEGEMVSIRTKLTVDQFTQKCVKTLKTGVTKGGFLRHNVPNIEHIVTRIGNIVTKSGTLCAILKRTAGKNDFRKHDACLWSRALPNHVKMCRNHSKNAPIFNQGHHEDGEPWRKMETPDRVSLCCTDSFRDASEKDLFKKRFPSRNRSEETVMVPAFSTRFSIPMVSLFQ